MNLIILNYWGWDGEPGKNYDNNLGNHALHKIAEALIARMSVKQHDRYWWKRKSFRYYFNGYLRTTKSKKYHNLFNKTVQCYIWSYAVYIAEFWGYDIEELEKDWMYCIHGMTQYK